MQNTNPVDVTPETDKPPVDVMQPENAVQPSEPNAALPSDPAGLSEITNEPVSAADSGSLFKPDDVSAPDIPDINMSWEAPEFVHHPKSVSWYALLMLSAGVIAVIVYLLTKDLVSTSVIVAGALLLCVYGARQPRPIQFQLDAHGVTVGGKYFNYGDFRSFSVIAEGPASSIVFTPLKRFAALTTIYYAPEDEAEIVDLLSLILPLTEYNHDAVDRLMHRIRF